MNIVALGKMEEEEQLIHMICYSFLRPTFERVQAPIQIKREGMGAHQDSRSSRNGMSHTKVQDFLVKIWRIASDDFLVAVTKCSQIFVSTL
jgi:hypothetical protein